MSSYQDQETKIRIFKRIYRLLSSSAPQREIEKRYSDCDELQQLREGNALRIYCRLVRNPPKYNVLYVFEVDKHTYRDLQKFDQRAKEAVQEIKKWTTGPEIEEYLDDRNTFTAEEIETIIEKLQDGA